MQADKHTKNVGKCSGSKLTFKEICNAYGSLCACQPTMLTFTLILYNYHSILGQ